MDQWLQLHIASNAEQADQLSDYLCNELGALAVTLNPADETPKFQLQPGDMPLWDQLIIVVLFEPETDPDHIMAQLPDCQLIHQEILIEKNWVHETQKNFPAKCFADKLWVLPSWDENHYPDPKIRIDPGLAFGTGNHPTTSLCLQWLADNPPTDLTVIDYGCGSGILSLAACTLGAKTVYAVDHDEQAVLATKQNAKLNTNIQQQLHVGSDAILPPNLQAELIIANILAESLLMLYPILLQHCRLNGTLVLSGLLESDYDKIIQCYQRSFSLIDKQLANEWLRLVFKLA